MDLKSSALRGLGESPGYLAVTPGIYMYGWTALPIIIVSSL